MCIQFVLVMISCGVIRFSWTSLSNKPFGVLWQFVSSSSYCTMQYVQSTVPTELLYYEIHTQLSSYVVRRELVYPWLHIFIQPHGVYYTIMYKRNYCTMRYSHSYCAIKYSQIYCAIKYSSNDINSAYKVTSLQNCDLEMCCLFSLFLNNLEPRCMS